MAVIILCSSALALVLILIYLFINQETLLYIVEQKQVPAKIGAAFPTQVLPEQVELQAVLLAVILPVLILAVHIVTTLKN